MLSEASARELKLFHRALGDITRLRIVQLLATDGEHKAGEIAGRLRLSQPLLSWHLRRLQRAGIVRTIRSGREVRCAFDRERFAALSEQGFRLLMNRAEIPPGAPVRGETARAKG
ncbi:MAG: ArsR/SmtB family transcription factor [Candidatus Limnocylindria bacterium]